MREKHLKKICLQCLSFIFQVEFQTKQYKTAIMMILGNDRNRLKVINFNLIKVFISIVFNGILLAYVKCFIS